MPFCAREQACKRHADGVCINQCGGGHKGDEHIGNVRILLKNINRMSMTSGRPLFDPKYGAIRYYPSAQIATVMKAVTESIDKGTSALRCRCSPSQVSAGHTLYTGKNREPAFVNISSLKFQGFVLIPVMSAVVVAVAASHDTDTHKPRSPVRRPSEDSS